MGKESSNNYREGGGNERKISAQTHNGILKQIEMKVVHIGESEDVEYRR